MNENTGLIAVWSDAAPPRDATLAALHGVGANHLVVPECPSDADVAQVAAARVHIIGGGWFGRDRIDALPGAELIVRAGVGVDRVDLDAASERGILVANTPDYCVGEVGDHATLLMLAAWRGLPALQRQTTGPWTAATYPRSARLQGSTLGIVGFGRIGRAMAERALGLGMRVVAADPYVDGREFGRTAVTRVDLPELLAVSDVISLHLPLTAETHHILGRDSFAAMRRQPLIVNTARGGLVDAEALLEALAAGRVRGAGLDVVEGEPDPGDLADRLERAGAIVTPHAAWYSEGAVEQLGQNAAATALEYLASGTVEHPLNPVEHPLNPQERHAHAD